MSKNTSNTGFRKVNVDAFDEDNFTDETLNVDLASEVSQRSNAVRTLISSKDYAGALHKALENPPQGTADMAVKNENLRTVLDVVSSMKQADIGPTVKQLSDEECDVMMKYVYKGMETPDEAYSAALLTFHKHLVDKVGLGSVVRVMSDRHTV